MARPGFQTTGPVPESCSSFPVPILGILGFPACNAEDAGDEGLMPGSGRSLAGGNDNSLQYSCPEKSHGQNSLLGCSAWGHKESDMTE